MGDRGGGAPSRRRPQSRKQRREDGVLRLPLGDGPSGRSPAEGLEAQRLDPLSAAPTHLVAFCLLCMADYDGAIREFKKALALYPHWVWGWIKLSGAYARKGASREGLEASPGRTRSGGRRVRLPSDGWLTPTLNAATRSGEGIIAELMAPRDGTPVDTVILRAPRDSRDTDASFECLERGFREHSPNLYFLRLMPRLFPDRVYADPRYRSLLERMRLA